MAILGVLSVSFIGGLGFLCGAVIGCKKADRFDSTDVVGVLYGWLGILASTPLIAIVGAASGVSITVVKTISVAILILGTAITTYSLPGYGLEAE